MALQIAELWLWRNFHSALRIHKFSRTLGDTSDIVTKEMYTFEDRGGDRRTLRRRYAGVARALISNGLAQNLPQIFLPGPNVPI